MTLADWDLKVKPHLDFIMAGAEMAARHARRLPCKADFATLAEHELACTRVALEAALQNVIAAQDAYQNKPQENSLAA